MLKVLIEILFARQKKTKEALKEEIRQLREMQQIQMRQIKMHLTFGSQVELQNQDPLRAPAAP